MRVIVYDEVGGVALDYDTRSDSVSLCPGRLEKAQVVEALQEAAFFILDTPAPAPEGRAFRQHVYEGTRGSNLRPSGPNLPLRAAARPVHRGS